MTTNDWVLYFGVPITAFFLLFMFQAYRNRQKTLEKIKLSFGENPKKKYFYEEYENIAHGFYYTENSQQDIDDITWNDMNMDQVFKTMDNTYSSLGSEVLYKLLRKPIVSKDELNERDRLMEYFSQHEDERVRLSYKYSHFGFSRKMAVADYIECLGDCPHRSWLPHVIMMVLFIVSVLYCLCVDTVMGMAFIMVMAGINITTYFKFKAEIENYFLCVKYVFSMCACADKITAMKIPGIQEYSKRLNGIIEEFGSMLSFSFIMSSSGGGIIEFLLDYIRMLTHLDLVKFYSVVKTINTKKERIWELYDTLGYIEAMIAAASYRKQLPYWSRPEFTENGQPFYKGENLYHPLIENAVPNDITTDMSVLITGSNASGKSTFLRAAGINALLSQTIFTSVTHGYRASKFRIYSSMALKDNLMNKESYYMVEIKSLKRIMDAAENRDGALPPVLCFIDEVLRGTNTIERIAASSQILKRLSLTKALCFAATHDIELTTILEKYFTNYHFTEEITDNDVNFNFKLTSGRATSRNAIRLLGLLGYEKFILDNATEAARYFENTGSWKTEN